MFIKKCKLCNKKIVTNFSKKIFCSVPCQRKHYMDRPEIKVKFREYARQWRERNPQWKERHRVLARTKYRKIRAAYWKEYGKRPEVREKIRKIEKQRRKTDPTYAIADRLRRSLRHALSRHRKGKPITKSRRYGIDWKEIIENLKPIPKNLEDYEIDHIAPLHTFNLEDPKKVKKAFASSNLQWLTREENQRKSGKILEIS